VLVAIKTFRIQDQNKVGVEIVKRPGKSVDDNKKAQSSLNVKRLDKGFLRVCHAIMQDTNAIFECSLESDLIYLLLD
jgi:hypothetical protein